MRIKVICMATSIILWGMLSPLTLQAAQPTGQSVSLPKGTSIQKVTPGQFKFKLPDGRTIVARNLNAKTGAIGDCTVYDTSGRKLGGGMQCQLKGGVQAFGDPDPPPAAGRKLPPSPNYVQIDDEITWLPANLIFKGTALIDPDPPYKPGTLSPQPDPPGGMKPPMPYK